MHSVRRWNDPAIAPQDLFGIPIKETCRAHHLCLGIPDGFALFKRDDGRNLIDPRPDDVSDPVQKLGPRGRRRFAPDVKSRLRRGKRIVQILRRRPRKLAQNGFCAGVDDILKAPAIRNPFTADQQPDIWIAGRCPFALCRALLCCRVAHPVPHLEFRLFGFYAFARK